MKIETCDIKGLVEITPDVFNDNRGYFYETYNNRISIKIYSKEFR